MQGRVRNTEASASECATEPIKFCTEISLIYAQGTLASSEVCGIQCDNVALGKVSIPRGYPDGAPSVFLSMENRPQGPHQAKGLVANMLG